MASGGAPHRSAATTGDRGVPVAGAGYGTRRRYWRPREPIDLIGRDEERAFADAALMEFAHRSGTASGTAPTGGLVIAAPAGIGKTALVAAIARAARDRGFATIGVTGSASASGIPLGPFAPLMPARGPLAPPPSPESERASAPLDLLQSARTAVLSRVGGRGLVLLADDAHLFDGPSAALVRQLASAGQVFPVVALRPVEEVPADVRSLWKEGIAQRIELVSLSRTESVELAESLLDGRIGGALADRLWTTTDGNPLYLRELIAAGVSSGAIEFTGEVWMLRSGLQLGSRLPALLSDRLANLPPEATRAVRVLAVAGPLRLSLAEQVIGRDALLAAETAGLVVVAPDSGGADDVQQRQAGGGAGGEPAVMVVHPLYTELLRERVPRLQATQIGRDVAAALRASDGLRPADRLRCLVWELDAGVPQDGPTLLAGAAQAVQVQDPALAARLARGALAAGAGRPARLALADALYRLGRPAEGLRVLDEGGDGDGDTDEARTETNVLRVYLLNWGLGDFDGASEVVDHALRTIADASCRSWLVGLRASMDFFAGRPREAISRAEPALATPGMSVRARLGVWSGLAPALAFCGRFAEAERMSLAGLEPSTADEDEVPVAVSWAVGALNLCYIFAGRVAELERLADGVYQSELRAGHDEGRSLGAASLGHVALSRGRIAEAVRWLAEAHLTTGADWGGIGLFTAGTLALAQVLRGDLAAARRTIDDGRAHTAPVAVAFVPAVDIAEGWLAAAQGNVGRAQRLLREVADRAAEGGQVGFEIEAVDAMSRVGAAGAVADRLAALAERSEGPLAPLVARHAGALASSDADGLDRVSADLAAQQMLARAGSAAAAAGALHAAAGRNAAAAASRERASAWLAGFEGVLPPDVTAWSTPQLTARERQICLLAAAGYTSKQIANELVISTRTVDGHLASAYGKLGISGRAELRHVLMMDRQG